MVSRSSRQYVRLFGEASPAELLLLLGLFLLSFRELLLSLCTPTFALEDAIILLFGGLSRTIYKHPAGTELGTDMSEGGTRGGGEFSSVHLLCLASLMSLVFGHSLTREV